MPVSPNTRSRGTAALFAALIGALVASPSFGQVQSGSAPPVAITLDQLDGSTVELSVVHLQTVERRGGQIVTRLRIDTRFKVSGNHVKGIANRTHTNEFGTQHGTVQNIDVQLEKPDQFSHAGGGDRVWLFNDGVMSTLNVFKSGAFKRDIFFERRDGKLMCRVREDFAREQGKGPIIFNSTVDSFLLTLISNKVLSASCKIIA